MSGGADSPEGGADPSEHVTDPSEGDADPSEHVTDPSEDVADSSRSAVRSEGADSVVDPIEDDEDSPAAAVATPRRPSRTVSLIIGGLVLLLIAGGIAAAVLFVTRDKPTKATAGDCLTSDGIDPSGGGKPAAVNLKIVDCGAGSAKYKVLGRVNSQPESEAKADSRLCDQYQGTEYIYWEGVSGEKGTILCLATNRK